MYWNPRADARWDKGRLILDLNEEPVFVLDKSLGKDGLLEMLAGAKRPRSECDVSMAFVPAEQGGGVDLEVRLKNNSRRTMTDVLVDLRDVKHQFTWSGEWLARNPVAQVGDVPAGENRGVRFETVLDGQAPYEGGGLRAHVYSRDLQVAGDDRLWLIPAARVGGSLTIDGRLSEWQNERAAWLAYVWSTMPMGRFQYQLYENVEHFSYPPYRLDARAMFWVKYDDENLYLAIRMEDDQPILPGDRFRLVLDSGGAERVVRIKPAADGTVTLTGPSAQPIQAEARCTQTAALIHNGADLKATEIKPVLLEARIPWKMSDWLMSWSTAPKTTRKTL